MFQISQNHRSLRTESNRKQDMRSLHSVTPWHQLVETLKCKLPIASTSTSTQHTADAHLWNFTGRIKLAWKNTSPRGIGREHFDPNSRLKHHFFILFPLRCRKKFTADVGRSKAGHSGLCHRASSFRGARTKAWRLR